MDASDIIALGSTLVALGALILTAYIARLNLEHQRLEAHRGRLWDRKVDTVFEFLEWLEIDAANGELRIGARDALEQAPRMPESLQVRLTTLLPDEFGSEVSGGLLAVGRWRHARALHAEGMASDDDVHKTMQEVGERLDRLRGLVRAEVRLVPSFAEAVRPHTFAALGRARSGD